MPRKKKEPLGELNFTTDEVTDISEAAKDWATSMLLTGSYDLSQESLRYIFVAAVTREKSPLKVAEMAGVNPKVFYRNHDKQGWRDAVSALMDMRAGDRLAKAISVVERLMDSADGKIALAAARTELELQGKFVTRVQQDNPSHETPEQRAQRKALQQRAREAKGKANAEQVN